MTDIEQLKEETGRTIEEFLSDGFPDCETSIGAALQEWRAAVLSASVNCLLPALASICGALRQAAPCDQLEFSGVKASIGPDDGISLVLMTAAGRRFDVSAKENKNAIEVRVTTPDPDDRTGDYPIRVAAIDLVSLNDRTLARGGTRNLSLWFEFADAARNLLEHPHKPLHPITPYRGEEAAQAVALDGDFSGPASRELLVHVHRLATAAHLRFAAEQLPELDRLHKIQGYAWNEKYVAYDDTDKLAFSVPTGREGVIAAFHENIDIIYDHDGYFAVLTRTENLERIDVIPIQRNRPELEEKIEAIRDGLPLPSNAFGLDLRTGEVSGPDIDDTHIADWLVHGISNDLRILKQLAEGARPEWGCDDRSDFEERFTAAEDEEDDPSVAP